ncbi:hypothetical protein D1872_260110 [compost metagenome]
MTAILSQMYLATARSCVMNMYETPVIFLRFKRTSRISALIETSSIDTGSSATMSLGLDIIAPAELVVIPVYEVGCRD